MITVAGYFEVRFTLISLRIAIRANTMSRLFKSYLRKLYTPQYPPFQRNCQLSSLRNNIHHDALC